MRVCHPAAESFVLALSISLLASAGMTQGTIVSPAGRDNVAGNGLSQGPWRARYLQIHSDLGPAPRMFRKLAFRQGPGIANMTGTRVADLEVWAGFARPHDQVTLEFASNYLVPPQNVLVRRIVNLGPQGQQANPSPFQGMDLVFDFPVPYVPALSFAWEFRIHANTVNGGAWGLSDAHMGSFVGFRRGTTTGPGCAGMKQYADVCDNAGVLGFAFAAELCPPFQPAVLAIGATNPNLPVPGLCSPLRTDLALIVPIGTTDANGLVLWPDRGARYLPNPAPGATLHSQVFALDPAQPGLAIRNSDGMRFVLPVPDLTNVVRVSSLYHSSQPNGQYAVPVFDGTVGYGVVTQFAY